jgi:hypothetical protein
LLNGGSSLGTKAFFANAEPRTAIGFMLASAIWPT